MKLAQLPNLRNAVEYLCSVNNIPHDQLGAVELPPVWQVRACLADTQADELSGMAMGSYVGENILRACDTAPDDDCIEVLCDGEETARKHLAAAAHCEELDAVLEAFFDGELRQCLDNSR